MPNSTNRTAKRFARAFEANRDTPIDVLELKEPLGRHACFDCGQRREGCMLIELGDQKFVACRPCTERILKIDPTKAKRS